MSDVLFVVGMTTWFVVCVVLGIRQSRQHRDRREMMANEQRRREPPPPRTGAEVWFAEQMKDPEYAAAYALARACIEAEAIEAARRHHETQSILSGWSWFEWGLRRALALIVEGPESDTFDILNAPSDVTTEQMPDVAAELRAAIAALDRLREGLRRLKNQDYDSGYTAETYAEAILGGDEPTGESTIA